MEIENNLLNWWTSIDWALFFQVIKDIAISISVIYGAYHGGQALIQWRLELIGKDKYKLAKDIALKTIELANRLHHVRSSFVWTKEMKEHHQKRIERGEAGEQFNPEYNRNVTKLELVKNCLLELKQLNWESQIFDVDFIDILDTFDTFNADLGYANQIVYLMNGMNQTTIDEQWQKLLGTPESAFGKMIEEQKENLLKIAKSLM